MGGITFRTLGATGFPQPLWECVNIVVLCLLAEKKWTHITAESWGWDGNSKPCPFLCLWLLFTHCVPTVRTQSEASRKVKVNTPALWSTMVCAEIHPPTCCILFPWRLVYQSLLHAAPDSWRRNVLRGRCDASCHGRQLHQCLLDKWIPKEVAFIHRHSQYQTISRVL